MKARHDNIYPVLEKEILGSLAKVFLDPELIHSKIADLEERFGSEVYSQLLYLLCHLEFSPENSKTHWELILEHWKTMGEKLGAGVDFRVALLDYFISVNHQLKNPKIIEIKIFQKTQDSAYRDELTGLYNYRYFLSHLQLEITRADRNGSPLSLIMFDVDHFKCYNDQNGHLEGDKALRAVGEIFREQVRGSDLAARYGGEEFVVLLPDTGKPHAYEVGERIRMRIEEHPFAFAKGQPSGRLTVSGGVASHGADAKDAASLIDAADHALYLAKGSGRNLVLTAGTESRCSPRVSVTLPGRLRVPTREGHPFTTTDISAEGLQLRCDVEIREGDFFRFAVTLPPEGSEIEAVARAVRVQPSSNGKDYDVGARITEISFLHSQALKAYVDRQTQPSAASLEAALDR